MRAKVDAKEFVRALERVSGLVRNSSIPVLNAVLVRFEADRCILTSTNINTYLSAALPAQGDGFAFLLDRPRETARAFRQFEGELALEQTETGEGERRQITLTLSCGPRSAELHPFLPEDFPRGPKWEPRHSFTANAAKLYARVERVKYAVGVPRKEEARACLVSVQFSGDRIYALDGCRLAWDTDPELDISVPFMAAPDALEHLKLFVYLFGRVIPALSLVLSMALRFVPKFKAQLSVVSEAQRCIGRDVSNGGMLQRVRNAVTILSIMVTWALENAIETADSMKSRGYGLPGRTAFSIYRIDSRDRALLAWLGFCGFFLICGGAAGGFAWRWTPMVKGAAVTAMTVFLQLCYLALCLTPVLLNTYEDRIWDRQGINAAA